MVIKSSQLGSSAGGEDFTINIGSSGFTEADLTKSFGAGNYICTSSLSDSTLDVYFINEDGTLAGYANASTSTFTVISTKSFRYVVVYGFSANDTLTFQYKTVVSPTVNSTEDFTIIGPRITNVATTSLPNINNTTVITGQNFATDITATFTGTDSVARSAKSITRSSSTSITITRPDTMPPSANPYTLTLTNPEAVVPTSSNSHRSVNTISAGNSPVWVTTSPINYDFGVSWNGGNLSATDADGGSSVTYSIVSGSLPTGISLNTSTGALTGTPSSSQVSVTIRATDSGGNFIDRAFLFNRKPVWNTSSLAQATQNVSYSATLSASDDVSISSYTLVSGTLPSGLSLNTSTGVISGTPSAGNGNATLTFRATDSNGSFADRNLSIGVTVVNTYTSNTTFTVPAGVTSLQVAVAGGGGGGGSNSTSQAAAAGGAGAGGLVYHSSLAVSSGQNYAITIGGGGNGASGGTASAGSAGSSSSWGGTITANGGGAGGAGATASAGAGNGGNGGSGGGGGGYNGGGTSSTSTRNTGGSSTQGSFSGWTSYGNAGSDNANQNATNSAGGTVTYGWSAGGGGGAGGAGGRPGVEGGFYQAGGAGGAAVTISGLALCGGGGGGGEFAIPAAATNAGAGGSYGGNGSSAVANRGGGGGGAGRTASSANSGGNGGSGLVIVAYSG